MGKRIIRLTEQDLERLVKKIIKEDRDTEFDNTQSVERELLQRINSEIMPIQTKEGELDTLTKIQIPHQGQDYDGEPSIYLQFGGSGSFTNYIAIRPKGVKSSSSMDLTSEGAKKLQKIILLVARKGGYYSDSDIKSMLRAINYK